MQVWGRRFFIFRQYEYCKEQNIFFLTSVMHNPNNLACVMYLWLKHHTCRYEKWWKVGFLTIIYPGLRDQWTLWCQLVLRCEIVGFHTHLFGLTEYCEQAYVYPTPRKRKYCMYTSLHLSWAIYLMVSPIATLSKGLPTSLKWWWTTETCQGA